jgi:hypothetical protein
MSRNLVSREAILAFAVVLSLSIPSSRALAQYMYLDSNGDGVHTSADRLNPLGLPTLVDVYLLTDRNRDGSTVLCEVSPIRPLSISAYVINLRAHDGNVSFADFINQRPEMYLNLGEVNGSNLYKNGQAGLQQLGPGGPYLLCSLMITAQSGSPSLSIVDQLPGGGDLTSFGSSCDGNDLDNTLKLSGPAGGTDWTDVDGLGSPTLDAPPSVTAPASFELLEGSGAFSFQVTGSDPDGDPITWSVRNQPPGSSFSVAPNGTGISFLWAPTVGQAGEYFVQFVARNDRQGLATTRLKVLDSDLPPTIEAPDVVEGIETSTLVFQATVSDPEGDPVDSFTVSQLPPGASFTSAPDNTGGTFTWTPGFSSAGTHAIQLSATSARRSSVVSGVVGPAQTTTRVVHLHVANLDRPPTTNAPSAVLGVERSRFGFALQGNDPDGDPVVVVITNAPPGAVTTSQGNSASFTWTPQLGQAGEYSVTVTSSSRDLSITQSVAVTVRADAPPTIVAPARVAGLVHEPVSFQISASDPDGDEIASLSAGDLPPGATFSAAPGNNSGSFMWTPSNGQEGSYSVMISATSAARATPNSGPILAFSTDTLVTQVDIYLEDVPPMVTAPTMVQGTERSPITIEISAADPNGDPIIDLTADLTGLPSGNTAVFERSGPMGVLTWTPTCHDAGSYFVTFRASNELLGPGVATRIDVAETDCPPVVTAPPLVNGAEGSPLTLTAVATDPDGDPILEWIAEPLPGNSVLSTSPDNSIATLTWTPDFSQAGAYEVTLSARAASHAGSVSAPFLESSSVVSIQIANTDRLPTLAGPSLVYGVEGMELGFVVQGSDPDGDPVSMTVGSIPAGATTSVSGSNLSLAWTPQQGQAGQYPILITAHSSTYETTHTVMIHVRSNASPAIEGPATVSGAEKEAISFQVRASDPDGDQFVSLSAGPLPLGASFSASTDFTMGTFSWTPDYDQEGTHMVMISARSATRAEPNSGPVLAYSEDTLFTRIEVVHADAPPTVSTPGLVQGRELSLITISVLATDLDGQAINDLTADLTSLPAGSPALFTVSGSTGVLTWTPTCQDEGTYFVTFRASNNLLGPVATTRLDVSHTDCPPVVAAPLTVAGAEGSLLTLVASASDPDGDPILEWSAEPLPPGSMFSPSQDNSSAALIWTPSYTQAGVYEVTLSARAASHAGTVSAPLQGSSIVSIQVANTDRPPVISATAQANVAEGSLLSVPISATDPDAENIDSITADLEGLPQGHNAVFSTVAPGTGTLTWTPGYDHAGVYEVTFQAANALTGSATTVINVANTDRAPAIPALATLTVDEGTVSETVLYVVDPDGDGIQLSLTGPSFAGLQQMQIQPGVTQATLELSPGYLDAGSYSSNTIRAVTSFATSQITFDIVVANRNAPPTLLVPASILSSEGSLITFDVSAVDVDGGTMVLGVLSRPVGSTFVDRGNNTGSFTWTPGFEHAGNYLVRFTARDAFGLTGAGDVHISIDDLNRPPVAIPGGPYTGTVNVPIVFDGTASGDPDGSGLAMNWEFGDGLTGVGPTPSHTYNAGGVFVVRLTVSDGLATHSASTSAGVQSVFDARAFLEGGNETTRLNSGKSATCVQVEPVAGSYVSSAVDLGSIVMISPGTGSVERILAIQGKTSIGADKNRNGTVEVTACFAKEDLRLLFSNLPGGRQTVTVTIEGALLTGGTFRSDLDMTVVSSGGGLASSVSPNPARPNAVLTVRTTIAGPVTVAVFDAHGRHVRTLLRDEHWGAGYHDVILDSLDRNGNQLRSGVYFYRVTATEGQSSGRLVVTR